MKQWEKRKTTNGPAPKASPLPVDYLRLVEQTLTQAMEAGLAEIKKIHPVSEFSADGILYADEVLLAITLSHGDQVLAATTVTASADYNALQAKPTLEDVLSQCLDGVGSVFEHFLDPKFPDRISGLAQSNLGALEDAPFEWTASESKLASVWVKVDKSNPKLDAAAEDWLAKNDPDYETRKSKSEARDSTEAEEFLSERLDKIQPLSGKNNRGGNGDSGPIRH